MNNVLYICNLISSEMRKKIYKNKLDLFPFQHDKFHKLIVYGLVQNDSYVTIISSRNISRKVTKRVFFPLKIEKEKNIKYIYLPVINIPVIKNLFVLLGTLIAVTCLLLINRKRFILCDPLNLAISLGSRIATKMTCHSITSIITDIPSKMATEGSSVFIKLANKLIKSSNYFVFLTKQMIPLYTSEMRNHIVIEGLIDVTSGSNNDIEKQKFDKFTLTYAGACHKKYGIKTLVDAFLELDFIDAQLIIFGAGDYSNELKHISQIKSNIIYMGSQENSVVLDIENKSHILVNPRPCSGEYTSYSFPSKLMEYMSTGVPVLTTKLPGIPSEYDDVIIYFKSDDKESIKEKILELYNSDKEELNIIGLRAYDFVMKNKTNIIQSKKILELMKR